MTVSSSLINTASVAVGVSLPLSVATFVLKMYLDTLNDSIRETLDRLREIETTYPVKFVNKEDFKEGLKETEEAVKKAFDTSISRFNKAKKVLGEHGRQLGDHEGRISELEKRTHL